MREVGAVDGGVSVTEVDLLGRQVISEYVGGQVLHTNKLCLFIWSEVFLFIFNSYLIIWFCRLFTN